MGGVEVRRDVVYASMRKWQIRIAVGKATDRGSFVAYLRDKLLLSQLVENVARTEARVRNNTRRS